MEIPCSDDRQSTYNDWRRCRRRDRGTRERLPANGAEHALRGVRSALHRHLRDAWQRSPVLFQRTHVADHENLGAARRAQRRLRGRSPDRSRARRATRAARSGDPGRPPRLGEGDPLRRSPGESGWPSPPVRGASRARLRGRAPHGAAQSPWPSPGLRAHLQHPIVSARVVRGHAEASRKMSTAYGLPRAPDDVRRLPDDRPGSFPRATGSAISASAPASSTPVGPPPTMTNVSRRARKSGSVSRSAASKASRTRQRMSRASSSVLRPGARGAHSGWPK